MKDLTKTLQEKFGLRFGEAEKLSHKIEKLRCTKPKAKVKVGFLETDDTTKLVITLDYKRYNKETEKM